MKSVAVNKMGAQKLPLHFLHFSLRINPCIVGKNSLNSSSISWLCFDSIIPYFAYLMEMFGMPSMIVHMKKAYIKIRFFRWKVRVLTSALKIV